MADKNKLYPHLMPREIIIWEKWLELNQQRFELYEYDIRVGESIIPPPNIDANIAQMAVDLAKKRIDVLASTAGQPTIIEIKDWAGLTAVGQLLSYPLLFAREFPEAPGPAVLLIATRLTPDIGFILDTYQIPYELVTL